MAPRVLPIACLDDNYAYLVRVGEGRAVVVDPSEAVPVERALAEHGLRLEAVWNTHHHHDHVGGNQALAAARTALPILASAYDLAQQRVPGCTRGLHDDESFVCGDVQVRVLAVPGHTLGAIAFVVQWSDGEAALFTGDTLFAAGCGRLFEGSPAQMHRSLQRLAAEPPETAVYPGHEYTVQNLRFALTVDAEHAPTQQALRDAEAARGRRQPSIPSSVARELRTNPFLRTGAGAIRDALGCDVQAADEDVLAALRARKDRFR